MSKVKEREIKLVLGEEKKPSDFWRRMGGAVSGIAKAFTPEVASGLIRLSYTIPVVIALTSMAGAVIPQISYWAFIYAPLFVNMIMMAGFMLIMRFIIGLMRGEEED